MTDEWLQERCAYWQKVLRLQDWRMRAYFVEPHLLDESSHNNARVTIDADSRHARVWIKRPERIDPVADVVEIVDPVSSDPEVLLVHELLHVSMHDMDHEVPEEIDTAGTAFRLNEERHVINLSKALVTLDRKNQ